MRYLTVKQVAERLSISVPTVWRWVTDGILPKPVRFSPGCTRWLLTDIEQFETAAHPSNKVA